MMVAQGGPGQAELLSLGIDQSPQNTALQFSGYTLQLLTPASTNAKCNKILPLLLHSALVEGRAIAQIQGF